jgi:glycosyltransferase involved in cell wall biosynthesis
MRVVYFSQDYTPHDYRFLEKLAQTSHEVWYLRFETNPIPFEMRPVPSGIKVVDWMGNRTYKLRGWGKLKLFWDFWRVLNQLHPDLVHAGPVQNCGFFTALAGFRPMLLMSWGADIMAKPDENALLRWITKFTLKRADMITCDCLAVRDKIIELTRYPPDRIVIFPWGVKLDKFRPAPSTLKLRDKLGWKDNKIIITTRSLEHIYGVEVFLEAAKEVIGREPNCRILMLGSGSLEAEVRSFITQHNLEHAIHLTGRVPHDTLPDYFNEADLYVSTSYIDGTSVSLLEAMACNLPVVVTELPSNREWVTPGINGWLVPVRDTKALCTAILEALDERNRAKSMAEANLAMVSQRADWDKNFTILLEAYERLTRSGG